MVVASTAVLRGSDGSAIHSRLTAIENDPDVIAVATGQLRSGAESIVGGAIVRFVRLFDRLCCCPAVGGAFDAEAFLDEWKVEVREAFVVWLAPPRPLLDVTTVTRLEFREEVRHAVRELTAPDRRPPIAP